MIARITGTAVELSDKGVIVETGGIGYFVHTPAAPPLGENVTLHTHLVVREERQELYGFLSVSEKNLFVKLIAVSGVGPKTALQMLTLYPLSSLVRIIKKEDSKSISLVPGIGKKTAEKIVIDLKDKLDAFEADEEGPQRDLIEALLSLGFKDHQVREILPSIDESAPLQSQIRSALQFLQK